MGLVHPHVAIPSDRPGAVQGALGYASTGAMLIDEPTGALLFGANTAANRNGFGKRRASITIWNSQTRRRGGT